MRWLMERGTARTSTTNVGMSAPKEVGSPNAKRWEGPTQPQTKSKKEIDTFYNNEMLQPPRHKKKRGGGYSRAIPCKKAGKERR